MPFFRLLSYTDPEIEIVISAVREWGRRTSSDMSSLAARDALNRAIDALSSGTTTVDGLVKRLCGDDSDF